jgi:NADPH-dependent 2,4-dienoyl-CoA reductase/sulfur reductase-like enzyme
VAVSVFCGIGVCQACVTPTGERACLTAPDESDLPAVESGPPAAGPELAVVGAGPGGLAAALAAADVGTQVVVVDRGRFPGGQYLRQSGEHPREPPDLIRRAQSHAGIRFLLGHEVWRAAGRTLHVAGVDGRSMRTLRPDAVVLAPGAYDRVVPFPGWQLPGVVTVGGAQAMLKGANRRIGDRVLVAGTGPLLLALATGLAAAGVRVVGVADPVRPHRWVRHMSTVVRAPRKLAQAARYRGQLLRHRVPVWTGWSLTEITSGEDLMIAKLRCGTKERAVTVDAVAVGHGFTPQVELASALGCELLVDPRDGSAVARVDADQRTTVDGVFAAGELAGVGGADAAVATGALAGLAAARHLGRLDTTAFQVASKPWRRRAAAARRFADALHEVHRIAPGWTAQIRDDTVLCRCEGVTFAAARAAIALGADDPRALKLLTRAGMGRCQGRLCGQAAADLLDCAVTPYAQRPIVTPVPLRLLMEDSE